MAPAVAAGLVLALDLAGATVMGGSVAHTSGTDVGQLLQQAAATVGAFTVIGGAGAWLLGPRIRAYIRAQVETRQATAGAAEEAAAHSTVAASTAVEVATVLADVTERLDHVEGRLDAEDLVLRLVAAGAITPADIAKHMEGKR